MAVFTLQLTTAAGFASEAAIEQVADRLAAEPIMLSPALSLTTDGRWSSIFQIEATDAQTAATAGASRFSAAARYRCWTRRPFAPLADGRRDALDRALPNVADAEHAGLGWPRESAGRRRAATLERGQRPRGGRGR